jgi:hypothetical protein
MQHTFLSCYVGCNFNMESLLVDKVFSIGDKWEANQILLPRLNLDQ